MMIRGKGNKVEEIENDVYCLGILSVRKEL